MAARLYLDENIPPLLAQRLRRRGFDVVSAHEVEMLGKSDEEQLEYASHDGRVLLTFDIDFIPLAIQWTSKGKHHSGVLISKELKRQQMGELTKFCLRFLSQVQPEYVADALFFLQQFKKET